MNKKNIFIAVFIIICFILIIILNLESRTTNVLGNNEIVNDTENEDNNFMEELPVDENMEIFYESDLAK